MDRHGRGLGPDGSSDGVADRRFDLAGNLGNRQAASHPEIEIDPQAPSPVDPNPRFGKTRHPEKPIHRAKGPNSGHAVAAESARADDVDDCPTADDEPSPLGLG